MSQIKISLLLSSFIILVIQAAPLPLDKSGEVESIIFVDGKARKANLNVSRSKSALFSRERFTQKTARFIEVVSPNTIRIESSGTHEDVQLLGLMDMSPKAHSKLRSEIQKVIERKLAHKSVKIFIPRDASNEHHNQGYLMVGKTLLNAELLREGFGIMAADSRIDQLLLPQFTEYMQEAIASKRGVWNPERINRDHSSDIPGLQVKVATDS